MPKLLSPSDVKDRRSCSLSVAKFSVEQATGNLQNVALLTAGREAKGHGIWIDERTLSTANQVVQENGGRLRGRVCHETLEEWWMDHDALLEVPGIFSGISVRGEQLAAETFEWFDSFRADEPKAFNRLVELAAKAPDLCGISIEPYGYAVYVDEEGNEYGKAPDGVELRYNGMPALRVTGLRVAAFVSDPAANDGLFATLSSKLQGRALSKKEAKLIGETIATWNAQHSLSAPGAAGTETNPHHRDTVMNELLKKLKAKFGEDQARLSQALLIVTNHAEPEKLSVEDVEAALEKADLENLRAENAKLKADLKKAGESGEADEVAKLKTEKEELEKRLKKKEGSGAGDEHELGAPNIHGSGFKFSGTTAKLIELGIVPSETVDNLKKKFAAGTTSVSDLWVPEVYVQGMSEMGVTRPVFITSGAVARNGTLDQIATGGGRTANLPHFVEPYFDSLLQGESTAPTLQKFSSSSNVSATLRRVSPISVSAFAGAITGSDPLGFVLNILMNLRNKQDQVTLINELRGFMATAAAALNEDNFTEDVATDGTSGRLYDADMFADAVANLGEAASILERGAMIVHSKIHAAMIKQDDVEDVRDSDGNLILTTYRGRIPLFISDKASRAATTDGTVYETYVFGPGTIGMGQKPQSNQVGETASLLIKQDEDTNDRSVYDRRQFILHPNGAKWVGNPADDDAGPTDAELATAGNWQLGNNDVKTCGFIRIRTNG